MLLSYKGLLEFCAANLPEIQRLCAANLAEVYIPWKALKFKDLWLLKKALPSREEPDISLSTVNSKARLHLLYGPVVRTYYQPAQYTQQ